MINKKFGDKKIRIRKLEKNDLEKAEKFREFINSLVREDAKLSMNREINLKGEREFLNDVIKTVENRTRVYLVAECENQVVGTASIQQEKWRMNHVGKFGITIKDGYRGAGLGKYMMRETIRLAKKELKPRPKIIQLEVYVNNLPAISLYKKIGFKKVARIPKHIQYKGKLIDEFIMMLEL
jgi:ribosomal protein S18 acetylase RimI-like enzyme